MVRIVYIDSPLPVRPFLLVPAAVPRDQKAVVAYSGRATASWGFRMVTSSAGRFGGRTSMVVRRTGQVTGIPEVCRMGRKDY